MGATLEKVPSMILSSPLRRFLVAATIPVLGLGVGCNQQAEIPLAKVPPPPADFSQPKKSTGAPKGGSPENASQLYK
jgi:hypothetical protein